MFIKNNFITYLLFYISIIFYIIEFEDAESAGIALFGFGPFIYICCPLLIHFLDDFHDSNPNNTYEVFLRIIKPTSIYSLTIILLIYILSLIIKPFNTYNSVFTAPFYLMSISLLIIVFTHFIIVIEDFERIWEKNKRDLAITESIKIYKTDFNFVKKKIENTSYLTSERNEIYRYIIDNNLVKSDTIISDINKKIKEYNDSLLVLNICESNDLEKLKKFVNDNPNIAFISKVKNKIKKIQDENDKLIIQKLENELAKSNDIKKIENYLNYNNSILLESHLNMLKKEKIDLENIDYKNKISIDNFLKKYPNSIYKEALKIKYDEYNYNLINKFDKDELMKFIKDNPSLDKNLLNNINIRIEEIDLRNKKEVQRIKNQILKKRKEDQLKLKALEELENEGYLFSNQNINQNRTSIPSYIKEMVFIRDNGRCVNCNSNKDIQFDHIIPYSKGGSNSYENIQILCQKCNLEKSNSFKY